MKRIWTSAIAMTTALAAATPAFGQDTTPADNQGSGFGDIIVTAQKRAENLQDVPISATVVSADALASRQIFDPSQLQLVAPSLQVKSFNAALGASNFSIRGVGTLSFANSIESSVTSVIDGVVMGNPSFGFMNYLDVAQIEVLNGPQGMLFGKNASAGLVNITTKRPVLGTLEGSLMGEVAEISVPDRGLLYRLQGIVNVPLGSTAALRISGSQTHTDPIIKNVINVPGSQYGQDQTSVRAKLLWEPTSELSIYIAGDYAHSSGVGSGGSADRIVRPTSLFAAENAQLGIVGSPNNLYSSYGGPTVASFDVGGVQANIGYEFSSGHTLTSITAWRKFKADNLFDTDKHRINLLDTNHQLGDASQFTEELRLASPLGSFLEYQLGLYFYSSDSDSSISAGGALGNPNPPPPGKIAWQGINSFGAMQSKSYAAFGQATLNLSDRARLTFGGRYTYDKLALQAVADATGFVVPLGIPGARDQKISEENFSWRIGGQYDLTDDIMAYASVARGYKGPGFNLSIDPNAPLIMPEIPTSYEAGIKSTLFDRHLIFNLSAYTSTFKNFQAQAFDAASNGYVLLNAGALKSRGFEIEASAIPVEGLTFNLGVSYVDAYFSDFQYDKCYAATQPGCRATGPFKGTVDSSGNRLPNVPKWTVSLTGRYETPVAETLAIFTQAALYRRSSSNFSSAGDPNTVLPGYALLDASIGLKELQNGLKVTFFCRNCFDKRQPTFINANSQSRGDYYHMFGLNSFRTLGVSLEGRF